jgi:hypothetical protein
MQANTGLKTPVLEEMEANRVLAKPAKATVELNQQKEVYQLLFKPQSSAEASRLYGGKVDDSQFRGGNRARSINAPSFSSSPLPPRQGNFPVPTSILEREERKVLEGEK